MFDNLIQYVILINYTLNGRMPEWSNPEQILPLSDCSGVGLFGAQRACLP